MAKTDYSKHFKLFQKFTGTLREFCETRRPKLEVGPTKSAFKRIKKGVIAGSKKKKKRDPQMTLVRPPKQPKKPVQISEDRILVPAVPKEINLSRKAKTISIKHMTVIDLYLGKYRNKVQAYREVYPRSNYQTAKRFVQRLFQRIEVKEYVEYQRSVARSKTQVDLQRLVRAHKKVAFYDIDEEVEIDLSSLDENGNGRLPEKTKKHLRGAKVKYIKLRNSLGEDELKRVIEHCIGHKYTPLDIQNARKELREMLIDKSHDSTINSTNEQIQQWWAEFLNPPNGVEKLSAHGFAVRLESINEKVPSIIEAQARAELAVLGELSKAGISASMEKMSDDELLAIANDN